MISKNIISIFICLGFAFAFIGCSQKQVLVVQEPKVIEQTKSQEDENIVLKKRTTIQKNQKIKTPHEEYINLF